ncbi:MAG TPA: hypothetical protein VKG38_03530 [Solirubrobacteraceae bacterium]|nr:hypothetical protein [Solirubrobacteraceae bacterium]
MAVGLESSSAILDAWHRSAFVAVSLSSAITRSDCTAELASAAVDPVIFNAVMASAAFFGLTLTGSSLLVDWTPADRTVAFAGFGDRLRAGTESTRAVVTGEVEL